MTGSSVESHRDAIVARLKAARTDYQRCVEDVSPDIADRGTEWSIIDLLHHADESDYLDMAKRIVEESNPEFRRGYDLAALLRRAVERVLASIDDALNVATSLTPDQLSRAGQRRDQPFAAIDALELSVSPFEQHLAQLRDEIRPREGLSPLSP